MRVHGSTGPRVRGSTGPQVCYSHSVSNAPAASVPTPIVLVVDDHEDSREAMVMLLEEDGLKVVSADGPRQAFEKIAVERPTVIITDIAMPGVDGWTFMEQLKADDHTCLIPVIVLTAFAEDKAKVQALAAGATFFPKPFDASELLAETRYLVYGQRGLDRRRDERR